MFSFRKCLAALAACGLAALTQPAFAQININGSINRQVAPQTAGGVGRVAANSVASACGGAKAYPGAFVTGIGFAYRTHTVINVGPARCVTVTVTASGCTGNNGGPIPVMYGSTFAPGAIATGYLGDGGDDPVNAGAPIVFGVDLGANQQVDLVLFTRSGLDDPGACNYNITSAQLSLPASVPTLGGWAMLSLAGLIALTGFLALGRRRPA